MKAKILCFISALVLSLLISGCQNTPEFVGSLDTEGFSLDAPVYEDLESMVSASELIVLGSLSGEAEIVPGEKMTTTIYDFAVDEVLKGDSTNTIKFFQLGADGSDNYETKIKKNKTYVLFLTYNYSRETSKGEETIYNSISFEQGIFEVNGSGKLKSCTRIGVAPKLDNMNLSALKEEIQKEEKLK